MELKIKTKELQSALKVCIEFVPTKAVLVGWTRNFVFRDGFIYATDNTIGIYYRMAGYNFGNGFMVRAEDLFNYIQRIDSEEVVFNLKPNECELEVVAGRKRATFVLDLGIDKVTYVPGMSIDCQLLADDFRANLMAIKLSMSDRLPSMDGIFLHDGYAYATNGATCSRCVCKSWPAGDIFLPRPLVRRIEEFKDDQPTGLALIDNFIFIRYSNFVIFQRRLEEASTIRIQTLGDHFDSFKNDVSLSPIVFDSAEAIRSLNRVSVFSEREDRRISLKITSSSLTISAAGKWGKTEEELPIKGSSLDGKSIDVDCHYFGRLLESGEGKFYNRELAFFSCGKEIEYTFLGFYPIP